MQVAGGLAVAAACPAGVLVHDAVTGNEISLLKWPESAAPARGQKLLFASLSNPSSSNPSNSFALVSGMRRAWALVPVSARERAVAALGAMKFEEAAAAALVSLGGGRGGRSGGDDGEVGEEEQEESGCETSYRWEEDVAAEAGLALLSRALLEGPNASSAAADAAATLPAATAAINLIGDALSASSLHPAELFPLLPGESAPWAGEAGRAARASAEARRRRLRGEEAAPSPLPPLAPGRQNAFATAAVSRAMLALRRKQRKRRREIDDSLREGVDTVAAVLAARAAGEEEEREEETGEDGGGKPCSSSSALSSLLRSPSLRARMSVLSPALEAAGEHSQLAAALASTGDGEGALRVWREIAEGKRKGKGSRGGAAARAAAAEAAADLLSDPGRASAATVAESVPWLLSFAKREERKEGEKESKETSGGGDRGHPSVAAAAQASSSLFSSLFSPSAVLGEWPLPPAARVLLSRRKRERTRETGGGSGSAGGEEESDPDSCFSAERALLLLPAEGAPEARAAFLVHLVFGGTAASGGESGSETAEAGATATELALLLVSIAASPLPPSPQAPSDAPPQPDWKRAEAARAFWLEDTSSPGESRNKRELSMRARRALRALLLPTAGGSGSLFPPPLDLAAVSAALCKTDLWEERAAAELARGGGGEGDHGEAAARLLLLVCRDPEAAVELLVKRARAGSSSLAPDALLSMLLNPGEGRAPLLEDAVTLLDCVTGMAAAGSEVEAGGEEGKGGGGRAAANAANPSPRPSPPALPATRRLLDPLRHGRIHATLRGLSPHPSPAPRPHAREARRDLRQGAGQGRGPRCRGREESAGDEEGGDCGRVSVLQGLRGEDRAEGVRCGADEGRGFGGRGLLHAVRAGEGKREMKKNEDERRWREWRFFPLFFFLLPTLPLSPHNRTFFICARSLISSEERRRRRL